MSSKWNPLVPGDESRHRGPPFVGPQDDPVSTYFLSANRNKESIQLDLKSDAGRRDLERLVERADVLVESFRPGVLDRLGFDLDRLNELNPPPDPAVDQRVRATTAPRAAGPATTRSPRARRDSCH